MSCRAAISRTSTGGHPAGSLAPQEVQAPPQLFGVGRDPLPAHPHQWALGVGESAQLVLAEHLVADRDLPPEIDQLRRGRTRRRPSTTPSIGRAGGQPQRQSMTATPPGGQQQADAGGVQLRCGVGEKADARQRHPAPTATAAPGAAPGSGPGRSGWPCPVRSAAVPPGDPASDRGRRHRPRPARPAPAGSGPPATAAGTPTSSVPTSISRLVRPAADARTPARRVPGASSRMVSRALPAAGRPRPTAPGSRPGRRPRHRERRSRRPMRSARRARPRHRLSASPGVPARSAADPAPTGFRSICPTVAGGTTASMNASTAAATSVCGSRPSRSPGLLYLGPAHRRHGRREPMHGHQVRTLHDGSPAGERTGPLQVDGGQHPSAIDEVGGERDHLGEKPHRRPVPDSTVAAARELDNRRGRWQPIHRDPPRQQLGALLTARRGEARKRSGESSGAEARDGNSTTVDEPSDSSAGDTANGCSRTVRVDWPALRTGRSGSSAHRPTPFSTEYRQCTTSIANSLRRRRTRRAGPGARNYRAAPSCRIPFNVTSESGGCRTSMQSSP